MITLNINGKSQRIDADPSTPLLWVLRDGIGLTGTKYSCGAARRCAARAPCMSTAHRCARA